MLASNIMACFNMLSKKAAPYQNNIFISFSQLFRVWVEATFLSCGSLPCTLFNTLY